ncbi:MAG: MBL fold metallo-hydrolase [Gammaproteobacteria bacterium]|nr:MBL fold metallo-hydrolase [Gammaproteobacteria bacterium]
MRFASIGSGSRGNATVVQWRDTTILIDCGFSAKELKSRLQPLELEPADIDGILVTHEHGDHISGVGVSARKYDIPVWMTVGTAHVFNGGKLPSLHRFHAHDTFEIGDLQVLPYTVPHDAREPCQFVIQSDAHKLAILTDAGSITPHIIEMLDGCDGLLLECNHDPHMLAIGPYPPSLKTRVGGRLGHLSNQQAGALLEQIDTSRLQHLIAMHISEKNNQEQLARDILSQAMGCDPEWIGIADQQLGFTWRELT